MTGVSWGNYQDYLYGRFDGVNHEDEAQTLRDGQKRSHGGDVYYMCPGINYGKYLCQGVQRALDAGAEALHLEEPEFWVRGGYSEGFKREWRSHYSEDWQPPHSSVDAQWRASKLKYFLYRRALQQVFDHVQDFNRRTGRTVRCYVPTHSLLNYAHWRIVSPESSLARLNGCDGYIAQVWTGTARTPNTFRVATRQRTFETAFLEYGAMQNLEITLHRSDCGFCFIHRTNQQMVFFVKRHPLGQEEAPGSWYVGHQQLTPTLLGHTCFCFSRSAFPNMSLWKLHFQIRSRSPPGRLGRSWKPIT